METDYLIQLLKAVTEWTSAQFRKTGMDEQFSNGESIGSLYYRSFTDHSPGATIICERTIECLARWKAVHNNRPPQHSLPNISRTNASSSSNATSSNGYTIDNGSNIFQASPNNHLTSSSSGQSQQANLPGGSNSSPASNIMGREHSTMQIANILLDNASHTTAMGSLNDGSDLSTLPFEGYNLEELWNWMDSGGDVGGFESIDWANSTGFDDH